MLFLTKGTDRLGKAADGNTVSDYDSEEIKRKTSISTSVIPVEYKNTKINVLDNPGYFDFAGEIVQSLRVSDSGLIVLSAKGGIGVGTEKGWKYLLKANLPAFFYVSKLDEEHANFFGVVDSLKDQFSQSVVPLVFPILNGDKATGLVNVLTGEAFDQNGKKIDVPSDAADRIEEYMETIKEAVAETSEELMEKYFGGEDFTAEEMSSGVREAIRTRVLFPVYCGCAMNGLGTLMLLDGLVTLAPTPAEGIPAKGVNGAGEAVSVPCDAKGAPILFVFKTISDQYGKNSYFKVLSGEITPDMSLYNVRAGVNEKLAHLYVAKGKKTTEVDKLACGDIGVLTKLTSVKTSDTLCQQNAPITIDPIVYDEPCYKMAVYAKVKGTEDKVATGINKIREEDCSFKYENDPETKEMVISGVGDIHLDLISSKLKNKYGVEIELKPAKIAYRESIKKKVEVHGRHKKQSGGHGQFGDVYIRFEPQTESEEMIFADETVGGCVPKNFIPSVEKGLRSSVTKGVLAGYPVVFLKATLYFGSSHPVDSSDMAFQTAAGIAYKEGLPTAAPTILEPVCLLKVVVPDKFTGDIMGDLSKRRGRVLGMTPNGDGETIIEAEVPQGEMSSYAIDLRSVTQGRGSYSLEFLRYEEVPQANQAKIIEEAKKAGNIE
jgi:elongation factor G